MSSLRFLCLHLFLLLTYSPFACAAAALTAEDWPDGNGARFKGEPASIFGPYALFRTKERVLKRVPLRTLSTEECQRFYKATANQAPRAATWTEARGEATRELLGNTLQFEYKQRKLVPANLASLPEPELIAVIYGNQNYAGAWLIVNNIGPNYRRIQKCYPGLLSCVFYGFSSTEDNHEKMALTAWMPWLVTKYSRQGKLPSLRRFEESKTPLFAILTRHGEALLLQEPKDMNIVRSQVDELVELAWLTNPNNGSTWADREHYGRAVRPLQFATLTTGPELIGNPLRADGLRARGIKRIEARLQIDATGKVSAATLQPGSQIPETMNEPVLQALRRSALFLPAIDHGQAVAATYDYCLEIPPSSPQDESNATWIDRSMRGEIPLRDWLLLTSLPVSENDFSNIERVEDDGTVHLKSFEVSTTAVTKKAQVSAFNSNYFDAQGPASVMPKAGQTETIDGRTLTWRSIKSLDGYVDMKGGHKTGPDEYCVGYAYTEIEVSTKMVAWLGVGSDDGLKVWLNGELVNDHWLHRVSHLDDDVVPLKLKAGTNRILMKVQNKMRDWSFLARLRFRDR